MGTVSVRGRDRPVVLGPIVAGEHGALSRSAVPVGHPVRA